MDFDEDLLKDVLGGSLILYAPADKVTSCRTLVVVLVSCDYRRSMGLDHPQRFLFATCNGQSVIRRKVVDNF